MISPSPRRRADLAGALVLLAALGLAPGSARAAATPVTLAPLPPEKLSAMEPILRHGDVALLEALPDGHMKQVTVIAGVAAPTELVRQVITTPEKWKEFVPGITRSNVTRSADGSLIFDFEMDVKLLHLEAKNRMRTLPDGTIEIRDTNPDDRTVQLWQLIAVPGGTVLVQYGYTDVLHANAWVQRIVRAAPLLEHGLALAAQLAYVRAMKMRAEKLATPGSFPPPDATAKGPGFGFLLARGRVAVIRSLPSGKLEDISILDNIYAPVARVADVIAKPADYSRFIEGVKKSYEAKKDGDATLFDMEFDISILGFSSRYAMRRQGDRAIDVVALAGDLRGAHLRWDLTPKGPKETLCVYRANEDLAAASPFVLGTVFRAVPLFEHGIAVAVGLVNVFGVRGRAEGWK